MTNRPTYIIRNEKEEDYRIVEEITRQAFWNLHVPGCSEHYLVHVLREHEDFIPELDFVLEVDGKIVGNIMYTKSWLIDQDGNEKEILSFGPLTVHPDYQRMGYGKALLEYSFQKAREMGYSVIAIFGHPCNYISRGFKNCKKYNVHLEGNVYPTAFLVLELVEGSLAGKEWLYRGSEACNIKEEDAELFDKQFSPLEKEYQPSQEEFYIYSHSQVVW